MKLSEFTKVELPPRIRVRYKRHDQEIELEGAPVYKGKELLVMDTGIKVYRSRIISLQAA